MASLTAYAKPEEVKAWDAVYEQIEADFDAGDNVKVVDAALEHIDNPKLPRYHQIKLLLLLACCLEWYEAELMLGEASQYLAMASSFEGTSEDADASLAELRASLAYVQEQHDAERAEFFGDALNELDADIVEDEKEFEDVEDYDVDADIAEDDEELEDDGDALNEIDTTVGDMDADDQELELDDALNEADDLGFDVEPGMTDDLHEIDAEMLPEDLKDDMQDHPGDEDRRTLPFR